MYTANIADTVMFRTWGSTRVRTYRKSARKKLPEPNLGASMAYHELADTGVPTRRRIRTSIRLSKKGGFSSISITAQRGSIGLDQLEKARFRFADEFLNQQQNKVSRDEQLAGCGVGRVGSSIVRCECLRIHVITHTADENLVKACARIPPEFGYYDIKSRYNPPQTTKVEFPTVGQLTWNE